jgi:hypothetical protein
MTGHDSGFPHAAARFTAEVDQALTRARRAAREARAESAGFRRRTEELSAQAKTGKLRGLRRAQVAPTTPEAHADAAKFRADNGLPLPELPTADELIARLPNRDPAPPAAPVVDNDDYSQHRVLVDVDEGVPGPAPDPIEAPEPRNAPPADADDDFSQQRILMDATVESYRPDHLQDAVFEPSDEENRR